MIAVLVNIDAPLSYALVLIRASWWGNFRLQKEYFLPEDRKRNFRMSFTTQ